MRILTSRPIVGSIILSACLPLGALADTIPISSTHTTVSAQPATASTAEALTAIQVATDWPW
ncbi:MAG: hypothetical protein QG671_1492 [Actinomycetota bacterium]|nr:hypothetical protein [Actinomycetota bacterium]